MIQLIFGFLKITVGFEICPRNSTEKCFEKTKQCFKKYKRAYKLAILSKIRKSK